MRRRNARRLAHVRDPLISPWPSTRERGAAPSARPPGPSAKVCHGIGGLLAHGGLGVVAHAARERLAQLRGLGVAEGRLVVLEVERLAAALDDVVGHRRAGRGARVQVGRVEHLALRGVVDLGRRRALRHGDRRGALPAKHLSVASDGLSRRTLLASGTSLLWSASIAASQLSISTNDF